MRDLELPSLKKLAFEAARRSPSLPDFATMWEYAADKPHNATAKSVYIDILSKKERDTRSRVLDYRMSFHDERRIYLHWQTLDDMMAIGYNGFVTVSNEIAIRQMTES